jgi:hypothetical protein
MSGTERNIGEEVLEAIEEIRGGGGTALFRRAIPNCSGSSRSGIEPGRVRGSNWSVQADAAGVGTGEETTHWGGKDSSPNRSQTP